MVGGIAPNETEPRSPDTPQKERVADVYQAVTSKPAQRTLLYTVLLGFGAAVLYGSAIVAYVLFYHNYLPDQIKAIPVYLQYV